MKHHEGPARRRGSRFDELGNQYPRTHAARYRVVKTLWQRKVHTGEIACELLSGGEGERIVRLTATYIDLEGTQVVKPVICEHEGEERQVVSALTEIVRARHPTTAPRDRTMAVVEVELPPARPGTDVCVLPGPHGLTGAQRETLLRLRSVGLLERTVYYRRQPKRHGLAIVIDKAGSWFLIQADGQIRFPDPEEHERAQRKHPRPI